MEVTLTQDIDQGPYYSPAVDVTGYDKVSIILQATADGTMDVDVSPDGVSGWTDYGGMDLRANEKAVYQLPMGTNKSLRYTVNTTGSITTSYVFMGGYVNG